MPGAGAWMRANLTTQGYCLTDGERRRLAVGLRFSTGMCLALVVTALAAAVRGARDFALFAVGLVAGAGTRHPFDYVWNHAVRHAVGGPALPPNPRRRRDAFKVATAWLALVGILLAAGATYGRARARRAARRGLRDRHRHQPVPAVRAVRPARAQARSFQANHHLKGGTVR